MLVLNRRNQEKLRIGDDIIVTICNIDGGNVKVGIECNKSITILREEIYSKMPKGFKMENKWTGVHDKNGRKIYEGDTLSSVSSQSDWMVSDIVSFLKFLGAYEKEHGVDLCDSIVVKDIPRETENVK